MIGANLAIGNLPFQRKGGSSPAESMTVTVGVVSEAPTIYAGYSDGSLLGATGALVGTLLGYSPIFVCTIDSTTDQMQIYVTGDVVAEFTGHTISVNGEPVFPNLSTEGGALNFNGGQTVILRTVPIDPADLWTNHIGEQFVFTID